ncbi:FAD-dependent oxidoreductase [bacterium]|nr:FAD-dependent oxidoreductase [bacterium]
MLRYHLAGLLSVCLLAFQLQSAASDNTQYDGVGSRGTSADAAAAIQAARMGKTTIVIEPGRHIGGLTSGGLGWTDSGNKDIISGSFARVLQGAMSGPSWCDLSRTLRKEFP